ncbi:lactate utilization protein [Lachnoclostridium sp. MSJ-17]|uniref:lactate utilization protein n=1 Tax=Lachnoclostridium sp. MSJ-17 TaxID=2841516 RepID=UPI001C1129E2|nr:lactate utilization protein [Lachnoclostridium sp. MSJ-17]MBU5462042.1 lactate utilization protein [Lachnoclostridium sp. MSJ-17]
MTDELKARIEKTMQNLRRNRMEAYYCENSAEARELVKTLISKGDVISNGGSVTLKQTGIYDIISSSDYNYLDRSREGITREEVEEVYRKTFCADAFFTSSNAVTENGELYNVDGNSNRVAAILYGPKSVIVVCGVNKLVRNIAQAVERVKTKAAPPNTVRLGIDTYCAKSGQCVSLNKENPEMCEGCHSDGRICCNYVVCAQQRHVNRIKVIIINEELGY